MFRPRTHSYHPVRPLEIYNLCDSQTDTVMERTYSHLRFVFDKFLIKKDDVFPHSLRGEGKEFRK